MRHGHFRCQFTNRGLRQLAKKVFTKIKTNRDAVDPNQSDHMLDVIDIMIDRALLFVRTDENRVYTDHATPFPNQPDLFVANVAFNVIKLPNVRVRNDQRFARKIDNLFESFRIDVGEIEDDPEALTLADNIPSERS